MYGSNYVHLAGRCWQNRPEKQSVSRIVLYWICTVLISLPYLKEYSAWVSRQNNFCTLLLLFLPQDTAEQFLFISHCLDWRTIGRWKRWKMQELYDDLYEFLTSQNAIFYAISLPRGDVKHTSATVYVWNLFINKCALFFLYWLCSKEYVAQACVPLCVCLEFVFQSVLPVLISLASMEEMYNTRISRSVFMSAILWWITVNSSLFPDTVGRNT